MTAEAYYQDKPRHIQSCEKAVSIAVFICFLLGIFITLGYYSRTGKGDVMVLEGRVNPNTAGIGSLVNLSGVGPARAKAIIEYRRQNGNDVFKCTEDIEKVKGIGPKTSRAMSQWLRFD
ncbi:MAG: helix-hairpin-helix domain-containing protein [Sedimentisphaerales bacterium]|nr:helix-hairpin-helix domain-containing protein [Sedimentisphaerales bacterium]